MKVTRVTVAELEHALSGTPIDWMGEQTYIYVQVIGKYQAQLLQGDFLYYLVIYKGQNVAVPVGYPIGSKYKLIDVEEVI